MIAKKEIELGDVQKTLLFTLWGRALEAERDKLLLNDSMVNRNAGLDEKSFLRWGPDSACRLG